MAKEKKPQVDPGDAIPGESVAKEKKPRRTHDERFNLLKRAVMKFPITERLRFAAEIKADSTMNIDSELEALEAKKKELLSFLEATS